MEGIISFCPRVIAVVPDESYQLVEMMKKVQPFMNGCQSMPLPKKKGSIRHSQDVAKGRVGLEKARIESI